MKKFYNTANLAYSAIFLFQIGVFYNKGIKNETQDTLFFCCYNYRFYCLIKETS